MSQEFPISLCMIVKNESGQIESCLQSIRPYVDEIVIVDTGSTDGTQDIVKKYCDKFESFTNCNDSDGLIADFSMARQRSFDLATHDRILWLDGDDYVKDAHQIPELLKRYAGPGPTIIMFPYEYSHDEFGNVNCLHYRERIVYPKNAYRWKNPVHEIINPIMPNTVIARSNEVTIIHKRTQSGKKIENGRNLRILKEFYSSHGESDVRQLYYLGLEYGNAGDLGNSIKFHKRYMELSGWDEEKFMACMEVVRHYQSMGDYDSAIEWSLKSLTIREGWAESYFSLARNFYFLAMRGGPQEFRNWEKTITYANFGLDLPVTQTVLFINPLERSFDIHQYLNMAYSKVGQVEEALNSALLGLKARPNDTALISNAKIYQVWLLKQTIERSLNKLIETESLSVESKQNIDSILNGTTSSIQARHKNPDPIIQIIDNKTILNSENQLYKTEHPKDIVIYVGPGPEPWTPDTINQTGIGGSETMAWEMSRGLASMGHKVRFYGDLQGNEGIHNGVEMFHYDKFRNVKTEICISSRRSAVFDDEYGLKSSVNMCWFHDIVCGDTLNHTRSLRIDKFLTLSNWHREYVSRAYKYIHPSQIMTTRNGIKLDRFVTKRGDVEFESRNPHRAVYSSSPDRGLQAALDSWHLVRAKVPDAELHIYYGFDGWLSSAKAANNYDHLNLIYHLQKLITSKSHLGVVNHGRVGQVELAREFMKSGVWAYPTWFSETSCLSAMEAQAAGLRIVTSPVAALTETVGDRGKMIEGDWLSKEYQNQWANEVAAAMLADDSDGVRTRNREYAFQNFGIDSLIVDWDKMIHNVHLEILDNIVPQYQSAY